MPDAASARSAGKVTSCRSQGIARSRSLDSGFGHHSLHLPDGGYSNPPYIVEYLRHLVGWLSCDLSGRLPPFYQNDDRISNFPYWQSPQHVVLW